MVNNKFNVLSHEDQGLEGDYSLRIDDMEFSSISSLSPVNPYSDCFNSSSFEEYEQRELLKRECLKIAFNGSNLEGLGSKKEISDRIRKAQDLFVKLEDAKYYDW